jgi:membrane-bound ClpP family serine protease
MAPSRHPTACFFRLLSLLLPVVLQTGMLDRVQAQGTDNDAAPQKSSEPVTATDTKAKSPVGTLLRVPVPITGNVERQLIEKIRSTISHLKAEASTGRQPPVLILEFDPGASEFGRGSEFEDSLKLARFLISPALDGIKTVAYLPRSIRGHALLAVMACDQLVMAPESVMGDAGGGHDPDHPIDKTILSGYQQIAESRHTIPVEIAEAMLDEKRKLLRVDTDEGPQLVFASQLPDLERTRTIDPDKTQVVFSGGTPALLTGRQARTLGVATHLAADRTALAHHLGLSRKSIRIDPFLEGELRPRTILIDRYIDSRFAETRIAMIDDAMRDDRVNLFCLWIDCDGGDVVAVTQLAAFLADLDPKKTLTVAYIPSTATGIVALIPLACNDIVMHPGALIGGETESLSEEQQSDIVAIITDLIVPKRARSYALAMAMFNKDMIVFRFRNRRTGLVRYFSEAQWQKVADQQQWERGKQITTGGETLRLTGTQADDLGIVRTIVNNFSELKKEYGLEADPALVEPGWVDRLVGALASPALAWLVILVGLAGIYAELQMPGIGVGGFLATVAFALYFWANFMNHTANELEIVLFLVGISCLILEIFIIPGFGIFGLGGGIMILISLILASQTFVLPRTDSDLRQLRDSLLVVGGAVVGMVGFAFLMKHFLPSTPLFDRLILTSQAGDQEEQTRKELLVDYRDLLGQVGKTTTQLTAVG